MDSMRSNEETLVLHCEGGHFVNDLESMSGLRSLEAQDSEIASQMLLSEGLDRNSKPLFDKDGSLMSPLEQSPLPVVSQPLKQLGTQGDGYSTGKCKISALGSFDKFTAASAGARLHIDVILPRLATYMHASLCYASLILLRVFAMRIQ
jgi:hypothetical protein